MKSFYKVEKNLPINDYPCEFDLKEIITKRLMYSYTSRIEVNESQKTLKIHFNFHSLFMCSIFAGVFLCLLPLIGLIYNQTEIIVRLLEILFVFLFGFSFLFFASKHYEINQKIDSMNEIVAKSITRSKTDATLGRGKPRPF